MLHATLLSAGADLATDHERRAFGRFYTPYEVADQLARKTVRALSRASHLGAEGIDCVDPFCGDGRLIVALLEAARAEGITPSEWRISAWDLDESALQSAHEAISSAAARCSAKLQLRTERIDAFHQLEKHARAFDVVLTNPPWEALKPDRREMAHMDEDSSRDYVDALKAYDTSLARLLPLSQPTRKFSGWGTNLSRCGLELSMRLCRPRHSYCGIVLPASLLGDQTSTPLRTDLFEGFVVDSVSHYPAEARLFPGVDQPFVTLVAASGGRTKSVNLERMGRDGRLCDSAMLNVEGTWLTRSGYRLPCEVPGSLLELLGQWNDLPALGSLEGKQGTDLWMGREIDETGYTRFTGSAGAVPFVKGRMVGRYAAPHAYSLYLHDGFRELPPSAGHQRIAWRDVSRRSQRRRVQATLLPRGVVTGNSLHVAYFRDDNQDRLLALLAVLNSLPVEFQIRSGLATGHVSLGAVRAVRIPSLIGESEVAKLASLARLALTGDTAADERTEKIVGDMYGAAPEQLQEIEDFCSDPYSVCEN